MSNNQGPLNVWIVPISEMLLDCPRYGDPQEIAKTVAERIQRERTFLHPPANLRIEVSVLNRRKHGRTILATYPITPKVFKG